MNRTLLRRFWYRQDGAVAVLVAICLVMLVGVAALAIELGKAWSLETEFQSAVDAAALAAATQLDQTTGSRDRARSAATGTLVQNEQTYASDGAGSGVVFTNASIRFLQSVGGPEATDDADAFFVEVTATPRPVAMSLAPVIGGPTQISPGARAVAGMGAAYCKVPPIFFCAPKTAGGAIDYNKLRQGVGVWFRGKNQGDSTSWGDGDFGLLALPQEGGAPTLSASAIRDAMAKINPDAQCFGKKDEKETKPGQTTSIGAGLNVRFDIWPTGGPGAAMAANGQYRPASHTGKGLVRTGSRCDMHDNGWKIPDNPYDGPGQHANLDPVTGNPIDAMGFPRDNCAYNGGSCVATMGGDRYGTGDWDIAAYMAVNHGCVAAGVPNWPACPAYGQLNTMHGAPPPGLSSYTRHQVYQWEQSAAANMPSEPGSDLWNNPPSPQCYAGPMAPEPSPDRRIVSVAVVDCDGLAGQETLPDCGSSAPPCQLEYWRLFLTEPVGVWPDPPAGTPDNKSLYVELIGPTSDPGYEAEVARYVLQLYE